MTFPPHPMICPSRDKEKLRIVTCVLSHDYAVDKCVFPITALCNFFLTDRNPTTEFQRQDIHVPPLNIMHSISHSFTHPQRAGLALVGQWALLLYYFYSNIIIIFVDPYSVPTPVFTPRSLCTPWRNSLNFSMIFLQILM